MSLLALLLAKIQPLIYKILNNTLEKYILGGLNKTGGYINDLKLHNRAPSSENLEP